MKITLALVLALTPLITLAQSSLQNLMTNLLDFTSTVLIPFLFGIAFLLFVINVIRFFVIGGSNEEGQKKAKALAIYSISAFVVLIIFWGLVNILVDGLGLGGETQPCPDFIKLSDPTLCP